MLVNVSTTNADENIASKFLVRTRLGSSSCTRGIHIPASDEPFAYYAADGTTVESEFPQPTDEVRDDLRTTLFLDAYDGHPIFRPISRFLRRRSKTEPKLNLKLPDFQNEVTSVWHMTIGRDATTIVLTGTEAIFAAGNSQITMGCYGAAVERFSSACK